MKKGIQILLALVMVLSMVGMSIVGCAKEEAAPAAPATPAKPTPTAEVTEWSFALGYPAVEVQGIEAVRILCDEIAERSGGRLLIKISIIGEHPFEAGDMLAVCRDRLAEMTEGNCLKVAGADPFFTAMDLPFLVPTIEVALRLKDRWMSEMLNDYLRENWNQFTLSFYFIEGEGMHHRTKLLDSFEALKGQKLRVWSKESAGFIEAIGAIPITVAYRETYSALEKGIIDGGLTNYGAAYRSKWFEICRFSTWANFAFPADYVNVNLDAYNELPADIQDILKDANRVYAAKQQVDYNRDIYDGAVKAIQEYNVTIAGFSPEFSAAIRAKMKPAVWLPWAERCPGDMGTKFLEMAAEEIAK